MSSIPDFSIIVPCYNQAHYLPAALGSLLAAQQAAPHLALEIIVIDDGSSDDTSSVARRHLPAVQYLRKKNGGVGSARNSGILHTTGRWLHFLDADDLVAPAFYATIHTAAQQHPHARLFFTSVEYANQQGTPLWTGHADPLPAGDPLHAWLAKNYATASAAVVRREALARSGLFRTDLRACEDWDLWIRLAAAGITSIPARDAHLIYRQYDDSMSADFERLYFEGRRMLASHLHHHLHCRECRSAAGNGLARFRRYCIDRSFWQSAKRARGPAATLAYFSRTCRREPALLKELVRRAARPVTAAT